MLIRAQVSHNWIHFTICLLNLGLVETTWKDKQDACSEVTGSDHLVRSQEVKDTDNLQGPSIDFKALKRVQKGSGSRNISRKAAVSHTGDSNWVTILARIDFQWIAKY